MTVCPNCGSHAVAHIFDQKERKWYDECRSCWNTWWVEAKQKSE